MWEKYKRMGPFRRLQVRYWIWQHDRRMILMRMTKQQKEDRLQRISGWACIGIVVVLSLLLILLNVLHAYAEAQEIVLPAHTGKIA